MDVLMTYHTTSKSYGNKLLYYSVGASEVYPTPLPHSLLTPYPPPTSYWNYNKWLSYCNKPLNATPELIDLIKGGCICIPKEIPNTWIKFMQTEASVFSKKIGFKIRDLNIL